MFALSDNYFMQEALKEAQRAYDTGEIPVGAIIVSQNHILARAHNQTERLHDVSAHAEMLALTAAANARGGKYLNDCTLYVTLEPCPMCAGALAWAQIGRIVYGASDEKRGCQKFSPSILHPKTTVVAGVEAEACKALMQAFFRARR